MNQSAKIVPHSKAKTPPPLEAVSVPSNFVPSQEQIEVLARRLIPEIKKFFADEQVQKEFARWQAHQHQKAA